MTLEMLAGLWVAAAILLIKSADEYGKGKELGEENYFYVAGLFLVSIVIMFASFGIYGGEQLISTNQTSGCCAYSQSAGVPVDTFYTYQTVYIHNLPSAYGGIVLLFISIMLILASLATVKVK